MNTTRRGYALVTLLYVIPLFVLVGVLMVLVIGWSIKSMQRADAGTNQINSTQRVLSRLRADVWQSSAAKVQDLGRTLVLQNNDKQIQYSIDPQSRLIRSERPATASAVPLASMTDAQAFSVQGSLVSLSDKTGRQENFSGPLLVEGATP